MKLCFQPFSKITPLVRVGAAHPVGAGVDAALGLAHELLVDERGRVQGDARLADQHQLLVALVR